MADGIERNLVDYNAELAAKVQVLPDLNVRLALIDTATCVDKFHLLQGLKDITAGGDPNCFYVYQRWGGAGTREQIQVDGPMLQPNVAMAVAKVFLEKTGAEWGTVIPGSKALDGKYWLQQQAMPDLSAKWEYYVSDGVDGKRTGWYAYAPEASAGVEELYAQHVANECEGRTSTRSFQSGYFLYQVDLEQMKQKNIRTSKIRTIRRSCGDAEGSMQAPERRSMKRVMKRASQPRAKAPKLSRAARPMKSMMKMAAMKTATKTTMKVAMKAAKKKSSIGFKWQVLKGSKLKTKGGMKADDLMKNKNGKVVSKKQHAMGRKAYERNLLAWTTACAKARKELGLTGFVAVKKGTDFYKKAKALMSPQ
jgi:hypothetical protein